MTNEENRKIKILLIEDEEDFADVIKLHAQLNGYSIIVEQDGLNGLRLAEREQPSIILLDIMLPGLNGIDVCKRLKKNPKTQQIPIIMISAKGEEVDIVLGLEIGADDYVSKPFSLKVLFSRIRTILRRGSDGDKPAKTIAFGSFKLDIENYRLTKKDKQISLTLSEFGILRRLVLSRGKVLNRDQLLDEVPNSDAVIIDRNIDVHIAALRRKLGPGFNGIETVRGIGYRFTQADTDAKN